MKLSFNTLLIAIIVLIVIIFLTRECNHNKYIKTLENESALYVNHEKIFTTSLNKYKEEIATQKAVVRYKEDLLAKEIAESTNLKNIIVGIKGKIITKYIPTPIYLDKIITLVDSTKCLPLPVKFKRGDKWWNETGTITEKGYLESDSLSFISEPMIALGYKKRTFKTLLKKSELQIVYRDKNPYSKILELDNIVIQDKPKRFGIGLQIGYGVTAHGLSPTISIGINYSLIKF